MRPAGELLRVLRVRENRVCPAFSPGQEARRASGRTIRARAFITSTPDSSVVKMGFTRRNETRKTRRRSIAGSAGSLPGRPRISSEGGTPCTTS